MYEHMRCTPTSNMKHVLCLMERPVELCKSNLVKETKHRPFGVSNRIRQGFSGHPGQTRVIAVKIF